LVRFASCAIALRHAGEREGEMTAKARRRRKPVVEKAWALRESKRIMRSRGQLAGALVIFGSRRAAEAEAMDGEEVVRVEIREVS